MRTCNVALYTGYAWETQPGIKQASALNTWLEVGIQNRPQFVRIDFEVDSRRLPEQLSHLPLFVDVVCCYRLLLEKKKQAN